MHTRLFVRNRWVIRVGTLVAAAGLFLAGAGWRGLGADVSVAAAQAVSPPGHSVRADLRDSYANIVAIVAPAVVTVRVEARSVARPTQFGGDDFFRRFFGDRFEGMPRQIPRPRSGLGSGVIVGSDGTVVTNHHVIDNADRIEVEFNDGRTVEATLVGSDEPTDLAVLKIEGTGLQALTLGDSDAVQVGDVVLAIGNPLGIGQTVTMGIISAKGRYTGGAGLGSYEDFLQTDAPINQGNSGGALVNTRGELIGINSQILSPSGGNIGIGFAIPANMARHVMTELRGGGRVRRAQLGVTVQPVTSDLAASLGLSEVAGAIVSGVAAGSAAEKAGIRRGDVITTFNGEPVRDSNTLRNRVAGTTPGSEATVDLVRDGRRERLSVTLDELASPVAANQNTGDAPDPTTLGVAVTPLTPALAARAGIDEGIRGLLVQAVEPGSRAADAGLREGDVIREVNRSPVNSVESLRSAVRRSTERPLLLLVHRNGTDLFLTAR